MGRDISDDDDEETPARKVVKTESPDGHDLLRSALKSMDHKHRSSEALARAQLKLAEKRDRREQELLERQIRREEEAADNQKRAEKWSRALKMAESTNEVIRKAGEALVAKLTAEEM